MTTSPLVSVLMATRGDAPFIRESIDSIRSQKHEDWELHILDFGSEDGTWDIVKTIKDDRIRAVRLSAQTKPAALNFGFVEARADLVAICDADDRWLPQKLAQQVSTLARHPDIGILGCQVHRFGEWGSPGKSLSLPTEDREIRSKLRRGVMPIQQSGMIVRKEIWQAIGGYDERCTWCEDLNFAMRAASLTKLANLPVTLIEYRLRAPGQPWHYWRRNEEWRRTAARLARPGSQEKFPGSLRRLIWRNISPLMLVPAYVRVTRADMGTGS